MQGQIFLVQLDHMSFPWRPVVFVSAFHFNIKLSQQLSQPSFKRFLTITLNPAQIALEDTKSKDLICFQAFYAIQAQQFTFQQKYSQEYMRLSQLFGDSEMSLARPLHPPLMATRYFKTSQAKNNTEQSSPSRTHFNSTFKRTHNPIKIRHTPIPDVSSSDTFINTQGQSQELIPRGQNQVFSQQYVSREGSLNFRTLRDSSTDLLGKRSVQFLMGISKPNDKSQYSKMDRRKQQASRKSTITDQPQIIEKNKVEEFCSEKLIDKYRELILKKDNGTKPFNLISKLYQIELLTAKEAVLMPKDGVKAVPFKLHEGKKGREIEFKVSKLVEKPWETNKIRQLLMLNTEKAPLSSPQKQSNVVKKVFSQEINFQAKHIQVNKSLKRQMKTQGRQQSIISDQISSRKAKQQFKTKISGSKNVEVPLKVEAEMLPPKKVSSAAYIIYEILGEPRIPSPTKSSLQSGHRRKEYQGKIHAAFNVKSASEIASLTKIMTCIAVIEVCENMGINTHTQKYKVGHFESSIRGTSAEIEFGDIYTIHQLLLGLMLPSGNDASLALARWAGNILLLTDPGFSRRKKEVLGDNELEEWAAANKFMRHKGERFKPKRCYNRFLAQMNKKARLLNLQRTTYVNSHGLSNPHNKSCCFDLAILCQYALQNAYFRELVSCKEYNAVIEKWVTFETSSRKRINPRAIHPRKKLEQQDPEQMNLEDDAEGDGAWNKSSSESDDQSFEGEEISTQTETTKPLKQLKEKKVQVVPKQIKWTNTHKLLHRKAEYEGIKTGVTTTAGACLASCVKLGGRKFIIVVLNSKKLSQRFTDTQILRVWVSTKEKLGNCQSSLDKQEDS